MPESAMLVAELELEVQDVSDENWDAVVSVLSADDLDTMALARTTSTTGTTTTGGGCINTSGC
ncbi:hypothetical protein [Streptomyces sp. NPDC020965]|uniref:hypothetical protein n=1 Tax=Streptomyces sp. NPDC020965 TaxID=3365105 RepID=UPI003790B662